MALRVTQTTLKRLDKLDAPLRAERNRSAYVIALHGGTVCDETRNQFSHAQRTVLSWPPITTDLDAWESMAAAQQDALTASSAEDRAKPADPAGAAVNDEIEAARRHQAGHAEAFRAEKEQERSGGLDLVRAQEARVRRMTGATR